MELKYRGIAYQTPESSVDVIESSEKATFLGARFNRGYIRVSYQPPTGNKLVYRGVSYIR